MILSTPKLCNLHILSLYTTCYIIGFAHVCVCVSHSVPKRPLMILAGGSGFQWLTWSNEAGSLEGKWLRTLSHVPACKRLLNLSNLFLPRVQAVAGHSGCSCTVGLNNTVLPTSRHAVPRTCLTTPCRQPHGHLSPSYKCVIAGWFPKAILWHGSRCDPCESGQQVWLSRCAIPTLLVFLLFFLLCCFFPSADMSRFLSFRGFTTAENVFSRSVAPVWTAWNPRLLWISLTQKYSAGGLQTSFTAFVCSFQLQFSSTTFEPAFMSSIPPWNTERTHREKLLNHS